MDASIIAIAGFAVFFNFMILKWKFENNRVADGILDLAVLGLITWSFSGSMTGLIIGMIGSMLFSLYLLWSPFNLENIDYNDDLKEEGVAI